ASRGPSEAFPRDGGQVMSLLRRVSHSPRHPRIMTARTSIIARMRFVGVTLRFVLAASGPPALAQQPSGAPADFPSAQAAPPEAASADDAVAEGPANRSAPGLPTDLVG